MFPANRDDARQRLQDFIPASGKYGRDRNHVFPFEHANVSRLSPAIRHRLLSESEVVSAPRERYAASTVEKFTQEIYWRRYWKSWLSLRPQVWQRYREELATLKCDLSPETVARMEVIARQESGLEIMDLFTRELIETGYLHNHARMWWAGWWIHVERLPWQLGADFFYRHLLDADPASNTLSWRWVAGLQTQGKSYLPRRSNLEKYLPADLLERDSKGLEQLEKPTAWLPSEYGPKDEVTRRELSAIPYSTAKKTLLWIHEEDLTPELAGELTMHPNAIVVTSHESAWEAEKLSEPKKKWTSHALEDALMRASKAFPNAARPPEILPLSGEAIADFCRTHAITQIITFRPEVGLLHDELPSLNERWEEEGLALHLLDRKEDIALRPLATGGFFSFWKKIQRTQKNDEQSPRLF